MMKNYMKKVWEKKDSKKGFTLVELIVVLVILAILAAIMVPALLGWIDRAKEKQIILEGRTAYLAAQTLASEEYGKINADTTKITTTEFATAVQTLAGLTGTVSGITYGSSGKEAFTVKGITYTPTADSKLKAVFAAGVWTVEPVTTP